MVDISEVRVYFEGYRFISVCEVRGDHGEAIILYHMSTSKSEDDEIEMMYEKI